MRMRGEADGAAGSVGLPMRLGRDAAMGWCPNQRCNIGHAGTLLRRQMIEKMAQMLLIGDPDRFQVDRAILRAMSRDEVVWWPVSRLAESLRRSDTAFLVRLESQEPDDDAPGGLIGLASIVAPAEQRPNPYPDLWIGRPVIGEWFVPLDISEARLSKDAGMVLREPMRKVPVLSKMGLANKRGGQETRLTHEQFEALRQVWKRTAAQTLI